MIPLSRAQRERNVRKFAWITTTNFVSFSMSDDVSEIPRKFSVPSIKLKEVQEYVCHHLLHRPLFNELSMERIISQNMQKMGYSESNASICILVSLRKKGVFYTEALRCSAVQKQSRNMPKYPRKCIERN